MATRFTDESIKASEDDFTVRNWRWPTLPLILLAALLFIMLLLVFVISPHDLHSKTFYLFIPTLLIAVGLGWSTVSYAARNRDLVMTTEFQNALLASATQMGARFCLIARYDGVIAYIDPGFQKLFPHFLQSGKHTIDSLLAGEGLPPGIEQKILGVLERNESDRVQLKLKDPDGGTASLMVAIDPLPKPKGYFLLRGRDFVEKRNNGAQTGADSASLLLVDACMTLPQGMLAADAEGTIRYINTALATWLGYAEDEIRPGTTKLSQICYQYGSGQIGNILMENYEGALILQRKNRTLLTLQAQQHLVIRQDRVMGVSLVIEAEGSRKP